MQLLIVYELEHDHFEILGIFDEYHWKEALELFKRHENSFPVFICLGVIPINKDLTKEKTRIKEIAKRPYKSCLREMVECQLMEV